MLKARLPLLEALRTTREQCEDDGLSEVLSDVVHRVEAGQSLASSIEQHQHVFGSLYVHLVRVGEKAGILDDVLEQLATYLERRLALRQRVRLALAYPGLILVVALGATAFLLTVIVPTFADVFASFNAELPRATRIVLGISDLLRSHYLTLGISAVVAILIGRAFLSTKTGRWVKDTVALRAPLFGALVTRSITAQLCRTLGTLLTNGVGLVSALEIQRKAATNIHVQASLEAMLEGVRRGDEITATIQESSIFPMLVVKMIEAGEKTAALDTMLIRAAKHYEQEVEAVTDTLTSILEPVLIVFIGALVGGILVAIYLPMFNLINVVQ
jgi:type IV pilus assembly protein PilC